jgi:hypothetical protein
MLGCHAYGGRVPNLDRFQHDREHFDFVWAEGIAIDLSLIAYGAYYEHVSAMGHVSSMVNRLGLPLPGSGKEISLSPESLSAISPRGCGDSDSSNFTTTLPRPPPPVLVRANGHLASSCQRSRVPGLPADGRNEQRVRFSHPTYYLLREL